MSLLTYFNYIQFCISAVLLSTNFIVNVQCYHDAAIGDPCRYDEDCFTEHTYCYHHQICACKEGFIVTDDLQQCIATVGSVCNTRHDCNTLQNSMCMERQCTCHDGFVPDSQSLACVQVSLAVGDSCHEDIQCQQTLGDVSMCQNGKCICRPGHHFIDGHCLHSKKLYESCNSWHDCFIGKEYNNSVECVNGVCNCKNGFYHTADNKCIDANTGTKTTDEIFTYIFVLLSICITLFN